MVQQPQVGKDETRCTYPKFMEGPGGDLLFHYRDGYSGNGMEIYNVYDTQTQTWKRFLDKPLISGMGQRNAYQRGPVLGADGYYHLIWMWRETSDVQTNNNLSYARSKDLKHWETVAGEPLNLPMTLDDKGTIIDPVPVRGGLHNSFHHFSFDSKNRVVVSYFKHDENNNTQAYVARYVQHGWRVQKISNWEGHHIFKGGGSGPSSFGTSLIISASRQFSKGKLAVPFQHWLAGSGLLVFDEETLAPLEVAKPDSIAPAYPSSLVKVESSFPAMQVKWQTDAGTAPDDASRYVLRWESLPPNRDRPRTGPLPDNSDLILYHFRQPRAVSP